MNELCAKDILLHCQSGDDSDVREAVLVAIKSLENRIPKAPDTKITNRGIDITGEYNIDSDYICSSCGAVVGDCEAEEHFYDYCPCCGQAIDWSEETEKGGVEE